MKTDIVVGLDEAGRGALAGPVVACALCIRNMPSFRSHFRQKFSFARNGKIRDSKKLSARQREGVYEFLKACQDAEWGIGRVSERVIDKINILRATKTAMERAVKNLGKKTGEKINMLLIDGNFGISSRIPQKTIIKGDEKVFLISLASIIAKVTRDRFMLRQEKKYPFYGFARHKGYGTKFHLIMVKKYGLCAIHRKSFRIIEAVAKIP